MTGWIYILKLKTGKLYAGCYEKSPFPCEGSFQRYWLSHGDEPACMEKHLPGAFGAKKQKRLNSSNFFVPRSAVH
jgi:hypothetical protein